MKRKDLTLSSMRSQIDEIDTQIVRLFSLRMNMVRKIGAYKSEHELSVLNPKRKATVHQQWLKDAEALRLSPEFINAMYTLVHDYALTIEQLEKNNATDK